MNQYLLPMSRRLSMSRRAVVLAGASVLVVASLAACSAGGSTSATSPAAGCPITVVDPWVKAVNKGMTAAFGTLTNASGTVVAVVSATSPASPAMELHEVVDKDGDMVMQPVAGGFQVPADGRLTMEPGGYHLMFMNVAMPIKAGEEVSVTISCSDGTTASFSAQARTFAGGDEKYRRDGMTTMAESPSASPMPTPAQS